MRQFILDTLLPYKLNPETCARDKTGCSYKMDDGRRCAVGKWLKDEYTSYHGSISKLLEDYKTTLNEVLVKEAVIQDIPLEVWKKMQLYHDKIELRTSCINLVVSNLENLTGFKFPELYF
ncbi:MAG: hypothetical protein HC917_06335 [Richelia sp. SM2_1_7]|nr:hypothetical protein [Richelia sp. SM2_1_7]